MESSEYRTLPGALTQPRLVNRPTTDARNNLLSRDGFGIWWLALKNGRRAQLSLREIAHACSQSGGCGGMACSGLVIKLGCNAGMLAFKVRVKLSILRKHLGLSWLLFE